jgi:hypothetical protein
VCASPPPLHPATPRETKLTGCCLCPRAGDAVQEARQARGVRPGSLRDRDALPCRLVQTHCELPWMPFPSPFSPFFSCVFLVQTTHAQPCRPTLCTAQRRAPRKARAPARTLCSACTQCSTTHRPPRMPTTSTKRSTRRTDRRTPDDAHKRAGVQAFLIPFAVNPICCPPKQRASAAANGCTVA